MGFDVKAIDTVLPCISTLSGISDISSRVSSIWRYNLYPVKYQASPSPPTTGPPATLPSLPYQSQNHSNTWCDFEILAQLDHQHVLGQCSSAAITIYLVACCEAALVCFQINMTSLSLKSNIKRPPCYGCSPTSASMSQKFFPFRISTFVFTSKTFPILSYSNSLPKYLLEKFEAEIQKVNIILEICMSSLQSKCVISQ